MKEQYFNNYNLTDEEIIIVNIYEQLKFKRKNNKNF